MKFVLQVVIVSAVMLAIIGGLLARLPQYRGGQKFFQKPGGQFSLANPTVLGRHNGQISL